MLESVFDLPTIVKGLGTVLSLVAFGLIGLHLTRRHLLPRFRIETADGEFGSGMLQAIMAFYGLALALIAVSVWQSYVNTSNTLSQEATSLAALYRDVGGYPEPIRTELQQDLAAYVRQIFEEAWPIQRRGEIPTRGVEMINQFQKRLVAFEPSTEGQKLLHGEALRAFNLMVLYRRQRLDCVQTGLPGVMWFVVVVGALISIITSFFFKVADNRYHRLLVTLLATLLGLVILIVLTLDRPFRGDVGLKPDSYRLIYDQLMKQ